MSEYWNQQLGGFNQGMGNIGRALMMAPRFRALQDYRNQELQIQAAREQAAAKEQDARTTLLTSQNEDTQFRLGQLRNVTAALMRSGALKINPDGTTIISPEAAPAILSGIVGSGKGGNDSAMATGNILKALNAVPEAGLDRQNKVNIAAASDLERANRPIPVSGALMSPEGDVLGVAPRNVPEGNVVVGQPDNTPPLATLAQGAPKPVQPKSSAVEGEIARAIAKTVMARNSTPDGVVTNTPAAIGQQISDAMSRFVAKQTPQAAPAQPQTNRPTRSLAQQYVDKFGTNAISKLKADGYDVSGYAD